MKIVIVFLFILLTTRGLSQEITYKDLIGVWDLYEDPRGIPLKIVFDFKDSTHVIFSNVVGTDSLTYKLEKFEMVYRLHLIKKDNQNRTMDGLSLIKMIDYGIMKMEATFDNNQGIKNEDDLTFRRAQFLIKRR
jgi:hypothetical protein